MHLASFAWHMLHTGMKHKASTDMWCWALLNNSPLRWGSSQSLAETDSNIRRQESSLDAVEKEQAALLKRRDEMQNERRDLWRDENGIKE